VKYDYENMSDDQFEKLIVSLCKKLLGISVQGFSKGPDGGRDAKFVGTAELYPSKAEQWKGTTIIQAKHTNGYNCYFSDSDFFSESSNTSVLAEEIPRIKKLCDNKQLDNYMLFSNRRLSGNAESKIRKYLSNECRIPEQSICLCGIELLEDWLRIFPDVPLLAQLDPIDSPLIVSPDELAEIIEALASPSNNVSDLNDSPVPRTAYERKNELNNMTPDYAKAQRKEYLKSTQQITEFLSAPENLEYQRLYKTAVDEFNFKIIANRKDYQTFDKVMEYLTDLLFARNPVLRRHKRLTRTMLFHMYWFCDLGETEDATAD
jgi:Restriction endonuclease